MAPLSRPGQMRHRVTVQRATRTQDPNTGIESTVWNDHLTDIPAAVRSLTSRELQAASARQSEVSVEFELRAGFDITGEDRISFEGEFWDLDPPTLDETRQRRMKIKASKGVSNG